MRREKQLKTRVTHRFVTGLRAAMVDSDGTIKPGQEERFDTLNRVRIIMSKGDYGMAMRLARQEGFDVEGFFRYVQKIERDIAKGRATVLEGAKRVQAHYGVPLA